MAFDASIFDGTPADGGGAPAVTVAPVQGAPAADAGSVFDGTPVSSGLGAGGRPQWQSVPLRLLDPDEPGYHPGGTSVTNLSREDNARLSRGEAPPPAAVPPPTRKTGYGANLAAAVVEGSEQSLNTINDPFGNMIGKPAAILGVTAHDVLAPLFGWQKFTPRQHADLLGDEDSPQIGTQAGDWVGRQIGAPATADVQPGSTGQALARGAVGSAVGMAALGGGSLLKSATVNPVLGTTGYLAGEGAASLVPDEYKPIASLAGNFLGSLDPTTTGKAAWNSMMGWLDPLFGKQRPVVDPATGQPATSLTGTTREQQQAGQALQADATDPQAVAAALGMPAVVQPAASGPAPPPGASYADRVRFYEQQYAARQAGLPAEPPAGASLADRVKFFEQQSADRAAAAAKQQQGSAFGPLPPGLMPGDRPTTAQMTGDPGLAAAEAAVSRTGTPQQQGAYRAQADAQNDARVRVLQGQAPTGDPAVMDAALKSHAAAADAVEAARVARVQQQTSGIVSAVDTAGQARVAGVQQGLEADRAKLEAESAARLAKQQDDAAQALIKQEAQGQARVGGLEAGAARARDAMGNEPPPGPDQHAQAGAALRKPLTTFNAKERAEENALWRAVDKDGTLAVDMRPIREGAAAIQAERSVLAGKVKGAEKAIFADAADMHDVMPFRDLSAFRSRLTNAIRSARQKGKDPESIRRLSMLLDRVHAGMDASVLHSGDQAAADRFTTLQDAWQKESADAADTQTANRGGSPGSDGAGGASGIPPLGGAQAGGGSGNQAGGRALAASAADALDPLKSGQFGRRPPNIVDWIIHNGGMQDDRGDFKSMGAHEVHQRQAGRLINPKGKYADYVREGAIDEGFLGPDADLNDLKDAIHQTITGHPVYRQHEQVEGETWGQEKASAAATGDARYNARDEAALAADDAGVRLRPAEVEHATDLVMQGVHPDEAVRQAASAGEAGAFDTNAKKNAFGSPGMPLAEQADNGMRGATRLEPNFDQAASDRYEAARAKTASVKGGFEGGEGVKAVLQGGPTAGSYRVQDASVIPAIVRAGPTGAGHVRVYLAKGGDVGRLQDAAAFSLRDFARRKDGSLDPNKVAKWMHDKDSFMSELPDAKAKFGDAAAAQTALETAQKEEAAGLKTQAAADARAQRESSSAEAQALKADAAVRQRTLKDATQKAAQDLKDTMAVAKKTVDDASARQADAKKAMQQSAVGQFLGQGDPVATVWSMLNNRRLGQSQMRELRQAIGGNAAALEGLRRAVSEAMERNLLGVARGPTSVEAGIQNSRFQQFWKHSEPALREVMTPEQMAGFKGIMDTLVRDTRSPQVGAGSPTAQYTAQRGSGLTGKIIGMVGGAVSAAGVGAYLGHWMGGGMGLFAGSKIGEKIGEAMQKAREASIQNVADLRSAGLRHPELYRILTAKVTPQNRLSLLNMLVAQLGRMSLVSNAQQVSDEGLQPPQNAFAY